MEKVKTLAAQIDALTLEEARELVKVLVDTYGYVLPTATVVSTANAVEETPVEQTSFKVVIVDLKEHKLKVVKAYNHLVDGKLLESKIVIEKPCPNVIAENLSKEEAQRWYDELAETGAIIEIQ